MTALETSKEFKVKGTALLNVKRFVLRSLSEGEFNEICRDIGFKSGSIILASSWYDLFLYRSLVSRLSLAMKMDEKNVLYESARFILEQDLTGIYKFLIKVTGTQNVLSFLPRIATTYTNFAQLKILINDQGYCRLEYIYPSEYFDWSLASAKGSLEGILNVLNMNMDTYEVIDRSEFISQNFLYTSGIIEVQYQKS